MERTTTTPNELFYAGLLVAIGGAGYAAYKGLKGKDDEDRRNGVGLGLVCMALGGFYAYVAYPGITPLQGRVTPLPSTSLPKIPSIPTGEVPKVPSATVSGLQQTLELAPGELFPAQLAGGCSLDPKKMLAEIEKQVKAKKLFNKLYQFEVPEGPIRIRVIARYEGRMQLGPFNNPAGLAFLHDGPQSPVRDAFYQGLNKIAEQNSLKVRLNTGAGRAGGNSLIDQLAGF